MVFFKQILILFFLFSSYLNTGIDQDLKSHLPPAPNNRNLIIESVKETRSGKVSKGFFYVYEDSKISSGKKIKLNLVILHSKKKNPKPDPVFIFAGGPGMSTVLYENFYKDSRILEERDIILLNQRGTGGDNRLDCDFIASDQDLNSYFNPLFEVEKFKKCLIQLQKKYDLTQYSSYNACLDINSVRKALGYKKINIIGGSYGTRLALLFMREYEEVVRISILNGIAPVRLKNPLYHALSFAQSLELIFHQCRIDKKLSRHYHNLEEEFYTIFEKLEKKAVLVKISHPVDFTDQIIELTADKFVESIRVMMYSVNYLRKIPALIRKVTKGDYSTFVQNGLELNIALNSYLAFGMLLCVTCSEDLSRTTEEEIEKYSKILPMGAKRVKSQKNICDFWPKSKLPKYHSESVRVSTPVLIVSGTYDPVTPSKWGEHASNNLSNSIHLIVPGAHGVGGSCMDKIFLEFLNTSSVSQQSLSCLDKVKSIKFDLPSK